MKKNTKDFDVLKKRIDSLNSHKLFQDSDKFLEEELKIFMSYHVYAVWDFMSIVKCLQSYICPSSYPWKPSKYTKNGIAHFINEIIFSEESDNDDQGNYYSHFDLYVMAMNDIGVDVKEINDFIFSCNQIPMKFNNKNSANLPFESMEFVKNTFECLNTNSFANTAAIFTFGRETTIPDMFSKILSKIDENNTKFSKLRLYITRHIDIDSSRHGPLSIKLFEYAHGNNQEYYDEAIKFAIKAIDSRIKLWDGVLKKIQELR